MTPLTFLHGDTLASLALDIPLPETRHVYRCARCQTLHDGGVRGRGGAPVSLGPQMYKATRRQKPKFVRLSGGYYAALRWAPIPDPSPASSKIRGIR